MNERYRRHAGDIIVMMAGIQCVREVATLLALSSTGLETDDDSLAHAFGRLADVAAEYGASPDDIQAAMELHEPALRPEYGAGC